MTVYLCDHPCTVDNRRHNDGAVVFVWVPRASEHLKAVRSLQSHLSYYPPVSEANPDNELGRGSRFK